MRIKLFLAAFLLSATPLLAAPPNIVILLADDMGFSDVGCYGSEINTPNIDALAKNGIRFSQFYNMARCCPSRACLLTGLYPHEAGVGAMTHPTPLPGYRGNLSHDALTIAEALKPAGYETYMSGKWHVTYQTNPNGTKVNWPRQRGFDRYYGTIEGGGSYFDPAMLTRDNTPIAPAHDPEYHPESFYYTTAVADNASRFIKENKEFSHGKPFFIYVAFTAPHWPLNAPEDVIAKYKGKYDAGYTPIRAARLARQKEMGLINPNWGLSDQAWDWEAQPNKAWEARCMEVYAAQVEMLDRSIGTVISALKETGQFDNTLIMFMSDNGACAETQGRTETKRDPNLKDTLPADAPQPSVRPKFTRSGAPMHDGPGVMPGPEGTFIAYGQGWANVSDTPFKEYKHFDHEGGISTPLVISWPAALSRHGELEPQIGNFIDLMPTCLDAAGATFPAGHPALEGISLLPAFRGEKLDRKSPIFFEHEGNRAVRDGQWKLVATSIKGKWELYDMTADRTELHDLAQQNPDRVKQMSEQWNAWAKRTNVLPMMPHPSKKPVTAAE